ncbi:MAG: bifunctional adenosylcobinamide kinase/adenosylcobinamide-phosphate guanylyltransferase [Deltaproteobacteria bacterium]|nr:bifunctional adenosylcobinamide kinase/adenosylcobinamide-phosphate guanylyltransferase [Deltaproteobacteria bacterium]
MFSHPFDTGCMLVLGGARSGKSDFALKTCNALERKRIFLATAQAGDEEMLARIRKHQAERGPGWTTVEEPLFITEQIKAIDGPETVILLDCLTLWLSNLFMTHGEDEEAVEKNMLAFCDTLPSLKGALVVVSNEVGLGIVPGDALSRRFRDSAGWMNQRVAEKAVKVAMLVAGLPLVLKDE